MVNLDKKGQVTFVCRLPKAAKQVCLAGDFNGWEPETTPMSKAKDGTFRARVRLAPGTHEYKFVADGLWLHDPDAAIQVANPFGTRNSAVMVTAG